MKKTVLAIILTVIFIPSISKGAYVIPDYIINSTFSTSTTPTFDNNNGTFDASGYIEYTFDYGWGGELTVNFWYNSTASNYNKGIFNIGDMAGNYAIALYEDYDQWTFRAVADAYNGIFDATYDYTIDASTYKDGDWHFVTLIYSEINSLAEVYIDNTYIAPASAGTDLWVKTEALPAGYDIQFGCYHSGSYCFEGYLDDISIFSYTFASTDVNLYYNSGTHYGSYADTISNILRYTSFDETAEVPPEPTPDTTNKDVELGLAIIITILSIAMTAYFYNSISTKKPWR